MVSSLINRPRGLVGPPDYGRYTAGKINRDAPTATRRLSGPSPQLPIRSGFAEWNGAGDGKRIFLNSSVGFYTERRVGDGRQTGSGG
jgi:hypothetical protein